MQNNRNIFRQNIKNEITLLNMFSNIGKRLFSTRMNFKVSDFTKQSYNVKNEIIAVLGYGSQGRSQSLNMRDQNTNVILGLRREGKSWQKAIDDGWVVNKNLFPMDVAAYKGDVVHNLLSDTAQMDTWPIINECLNEGDAISFSHGLGIVYGEQTGMKPKSTVDVFMVAPKGVGPTVRTHFLDNKWINASTAIHQDVTGHAKERLCYLASSIGCGRTFPTTFEKEVFSDLTGERCVLMGLIQGAFKAQFEVLMENGHSAEEAFNETVEEALESLYPMVSEKGMDHLYANCSMVAQRGALDWAPKFEAALKPVIAECYEKVKDGSEMKRVLEMRNNDNSREILEGELKDMRESELWKTGKRVRAYRSKQKFELDKDEVKRYKEGEVNPVFLL